MKHSLCFLAPLDACVHVYLRTSDHTATAHWIVWHVWELHPSIHHNLFPCAIFSFGHVIQKKEQMSFFSQQRCGTLPGLMKIPRSQCGNLSSSQAEIHGTGAVTGGDVRPCKVYLGTGCLSWSLFLCRKQGL